MLGSKIWWTVFLGALLLWVGCEETVVVVDPADTFAIEAFQVPARLSISLPSTGRTRSYAVAFRVTHPEGPQGVASVSFEILAADQSTVLKSLSLYDDGSTAHPEAGDVVALDGIWSNVFVADSASIPPGEVFYRSRATDGSGTQLSADIISSLALVNTRPVIVSVSAPDTLQSGTLAQTFTVVVQDSNDADDITSVTMNLFRNDIRLASEALMLNSSDGADTATYTIDLDSSFAAGRIGEHQLEYFALDLSDESSVIFEDMIFLENFAPSIGNLTMADSAQVPQSGEVLPILITVDINDPQGLTDIDSVYFNSILPNGTPSSGNPFLMYDNGLPFDPNGTPEEAGDATAGDGTYSLTIGLQAGTPTGRYRFSFFVRDGVNQLTTGPVDSLIVTQ